MHTYAHIRKTPPHIQVPTLNPHISQPTTATIQRNSSATHRTHSKSQYAVLYPTAEAIQKHREVVEEVEEELCVSSWEKWYDISQEQLQQYTSSRNNSNTNTGFADVLEYYNNSTIRMLRAVFAEYPWYDWRFVRVPHNFWNSLKNQRQFVDWLASQQLNITQWEQWYNITRKQLCESNKAATLLRNFYNNSPSQLLQSVYAEHPWLLWRFSHAPRNFWNEASNHRQFIDWVAKELQINELEQWYSHTAYDLSNSVGGELLWYYSYSLSDMLQYVYPEYNWLVGMFAQTPKIFWSNIEKQQQYLQTLGEIKLNVSEWNDWVYVHPQTFCEEGGEGARSLLKNKYGGSMYRMLSTIFSNYSWQQHMQNYFEDMIKEFGLKRFEELAWEPLPFFHYDMKDVNENVDSRRQAVTTFQRNLNFEQQQEALKIAYPGIQQTENGCYD